MVAPQNILTFSRGGGASPSVGPDGEDQMEMLKSMVKAVIAAAALSGAGASAADDPFQWLEEIEGLAEELDAAPLVEAAE